jgi:hypothetical protein
MNTPITRKSPPYYLWIYDQALKPLYSGRLKAIENDGILLEEARIHQAGWQAVEMDLLYVSIQYIYRLDYAHRPYTAKDSENWLAKGERWLVEKIGAASRKTISRQGGELDLSPLQP